MGPGKGPILEGLGDLRSGVPGTGYPWDGPKGQECRYRGSGDLQDVGSWDHAPEGHSEGSQMGHFGVIFGVLGSGIWGSGSPGDGLRDQDCRYLGSGDLHGDGVRNRSNMGYLGVWDGGYQNGRSRDPVLRTLWMV